ncbi:Unknown protein [Striga hermonthica]|uniref:Uncharacterized protein n=1 Tax=Striga hermonthica TaxID=68872 RepID=A0A9N7N9U9_STRHE|nr:Unknown protein [Striga hermonthica]
MASAEAKVESPSTDIDSFTYPDDVLVDGDTSGPGPVGPDTSQPDPDYVTSKQLQDKDEEGKKECGKKGGQNLKSTLMISGAVVAVIGAIFAIAMKIKEA